MKFTRWQILKALTVVGVIGVASLALIYFIPTSPSKVVMATAFKGASFEYYGRQYREIFARSHVELELRETAGAVENLKLLQDPNARPFVHAKAFAFVDIDPRAKSDRGAGDRPSDRFAFAAFSAADLQLDDTAASVLLVR